MTGSRLVVLVAVLGGLALLAGCSGNNAPTLPSPNGGNILITTSDGEHLYTTRARLNGSYTLNNVPAGSRVISASAVGFYTTHTLVNADGPITGQAVLQPIEGSGPTAVPDITIDEPGGGGDSTSDISNGVITLSGTVTNLDSNAVVLIQNGQEPTVVAASGGRFETTVVLDSGVNHLQIRATNAVGTTLSRVITINFAGQFYFRVTLQWDSETDVDLHNWSPSGQHSHWSNKAIDAGSLDVDNTSAYGPENFTCVNLVPGRFHVAADLYSGASAHCNIRVVSGAMATGTPVTRVFGPYNLTVSDAEHNYPVTGNTATWWRPCDIVLSASGAVSIEPADSGALVNGLDVLMAK